MSRHVLAAAFAAVLLAGCGGGDASPAPSPTDTAAATTSDASSAPATRSPDSAPTTAPEPTSPQPSAAPTTSGTSAPAAPTQADPPLSVEPVAVDPPDDTDAATLVQDLSDLELEVGRQAQQAGDDEEAVRAIAAQRFVGAGLEDFVQFALTGLAGVPLPEQPLETTDVEVLDAGPGCIFVTYGLGDIEVPGGPALVRIVATGSAQEPAWRVERQFGAAAVTDPDTVCPDQVGG